MTKEARTAFELFKSRLGEMEIEKRHREVCGGGDGDGEQGES